LVVVQVILAFVATGVYGFVLVVGSRAATRVLLQPSTSRVGRWAINVGGCLVWLLGGWVVLWLWYGVFRAFR